MRTAGIAAVVIAVAASAGLAAAATGSDSYRLATAGMASVTQRVSAVATVSHVNRASASFGTSGRVEALLVKVGQAVTAGQPLARLDATSLDQQQAATAAALAQDEQTLARDETSQTAAAQTAAVSVTGASTIAPASATGQSGVVTVQPAGGAAGSAMQVTDAMAPTGAAAVRSVVATALVRAAPPTSSAAPSAVRGTSVTGLRAAVVQQQQAVVAGQQRLDTDLSTVRAALVQSGAACAQDLGPTGPPSPTANPTPTAQPSPTGQPTPTGQAGASTSETATMGTGAVATSSPAMPGGVPSCSVALAGAFAAEQRVAADESSLSSAQSRLGTAIDTLLNAIPGPTGAAGSSSTGSTEHGGSAATGGRSSGAAAGGAAGARVARSSTGTAGSRAAGSGSSSAAGTGRAAGTSSGPATPAQLAADQARIDADRAQSAVASEQLAQATVTSPIAGTVAAVGVAQGQAVSAGSSTAVVTVVGSGTELATTQVPLAKLSSVKVGQPVAVDIDGRDAPVSGAVSGIGILGSSSGSTTTYPVTITLDPVAPAVLDGTGATVDITTSALRGVLTVPTSAVSRLGARASVQVLASGASSPVTTLVTVGAAGPALTQITSGLTAGQRVVLADLSTALPSAGSLPRGLTGRGGGGFGGGGRGTGGGGGGGARSGAGG